nr:MAG TPA: hypothetical protein [Caudoviricetes sp.]DAO77187.1 MAG TPA: hypothetical protein [Caudoviricetes sp.]
MTVHQALYGISTKQTIQKTDPMPEEAKGSLPPSIT